MTAERRLLASIHDVSPRFESQIDALVDRLSARLGGTRFAMLVVPDHWNRAPLAADRGFQARLRNWADAGVEMFVHGWSHLDDSSHANAADALRARHLTAGEGEFLGLDQGEALRRMRRGKALIEDVTGRPAAGFIAPAWLYSEGTRSALAEAGFALAEDHLRVWRPASGAVVAKGPVITWASRSRSRQLSSLAAAAVLRQAMRRAPIVRVAVHPGDTGVPRLLESIDRTLATLLRGRKPGRYDALAAS
ncbi:DUF2334 domain-containing protein [Sphingosinithalassobacter sp. LHW66-3]|uniref:DUF2334 domain-containing protein n=1 Tax=Sphingosinithalassobacter sp. LHW66-3 TaxID=3424718 RepID=UPI003D6B00BA